jgi:inorganic phosphate transporter, PiT family
MLIFASLLAFYLAWNLGANDVANAMGTAVGSKAITLRQALVIAGILEFVGAVGFGRSVTAKLATGLLNPATIGPQTLQLVMLSVLVAAGVWLNVATLWGLPVSSSQATVAAIAGVGFVAGGPEAVDGAALGQIALAALVTPLVSGGLAALAYGLIQAQILQRPPAALREWIPWLSVAIVGVFGLIVLPPLVLTIVQTMPLMSETIPPHTLALGLGGLGAVALSVSGWRRLDQPMELPRVDAPSSRVDTGKPQVIGDSIDPPTGDARSHCVSAGESAESVFAAFQLVSAGFVAFAHGANDVSNAIAPFAVIAYIQQTGAQTGLPPGSDLPIPLWILVLGGSGIVAGLAISGQKVMATIGTGLIALQPSGGSCAELATATTLLLAAQAGLPVSTSHALVGGVIGVGLVQDGGRDGIQWGTMRSIALTWLVTLPLAASLGAATFWLLQRMVGLV